MHTDQETFDVVAEHLLRQDERCVDEQGDCAYRGEKGLKCAIGCLIPDSEYIETFEGEGIYISPGKHFEAGVPSVVGNLMRHLGYNLRLLNSLQNIHDSHEPHQWPEELRALAKKLNINPHVVNRFHSEY